MSTVVAFPDVLMGVPYFIQLRLGSIPRHLRGFEKDLIADAAFNVRRGYGFVGGRAGRLLAGSVRGAPEEWPVTWREGALKYSFRIPRGEYLVRLAFVETNVANPGMRVFDVLAEDSVVLDDVDIVADAGDFTWYERAVSVKVFDGWLDLRFVAETGDQAPRVSWLSVTPLEKRDGALPPALRVEGRPGPLHNDLLWQAVEPDAGTNNSKCVVGYGVFRSESPEGPFESLTPSPVRVPFFRDRGVSSGTTYYYKVRAYGIEGGQGAYSAPLALTARNFEFRGLKVYNLEIAPEALQRASTRRDPTTFTPAEVVMHDRRFPVRFGYDTSHDGWQRRKSIRVDMTLDRFRSFGKRAELFLSAENGDWTQLREKLCAEAAGLLGLPAPRVTPVLVTVNGRPVGFRWDLEDVDSKFRKRVRLDRVGLLARWIGNDRWRSDWLPRGERVGKSGDIVALNELVQQLHSLHPGEIWAFFTKYFYLERWIDRMAFAAVRGELDLAPEDTLLLRDSRNGKWEMFRAKHRSGDWGIYDDSVEVAVPTEEEIDRVLFPWAQRIGQAKRPDWMVLFTRFFQSRHHRDLYLRRVESMLEEELAPDRFDELVDQTFESVREHVLDESDLWPYDGGRTFLSGPEKIKLAHRERVATLKKRIEAVRDEPDEPLVIDRYFLRPSSADAPRWVEIRNRSQDPVALSKYRLSDGFGRSPRIVSSRVTLGPGEVFRSKLPKSKDAEIFASHGSIVLWRHVGGGRRVVSDFVYFGTQTTDIAYGRDSSVPSGWRFFHSSELASPEAAADPENVAKGRALRSSPATYRTMLKKQKNDDLTIELQLTDRAREGAGKIEKVEIRFRAAGETEFRSTPMAWDDKRFAYSSTLQANDSRPRTEYYFVAKTDSGLDRNYPLGAPDITLVIPVLPKLKINEICPRPGNDPEAPGEFIELVNDGDQPISIRGLHLSDDQRRPTKWRITEKITLQPKDYVVFYADGLNRGRHTNFKLSNSGEFVGLYARTEEGYLRIDAVAFRGVPLGQSWGRKQDGTRSYRIWKDPTPGKRNLPKIPKELLEKNRAKGEQPPVGTGEGRQ